MPSSVAILSAGITASGGDRVLFQVAHALSEAGAHVTLFAPRRSRDELFARGASIEIQMVEGSRWQALATMARRGHDCDIVVAASPVLALLAHLVGRGGRITWFHQGWAPNAGRSGLSRAVARVSEAVLCATHARTAVVSEALLREVPHAKLLRNGIDLDTFTPGATSSSKTVVGTILSAGKLHLLPEVMRVSEALAGQSPELTLRVLTPTRLRAGGLWTEDGGAITAADFLRQCDVFISVAQRDGFALPPLEAMACGVPVVAVPSSGVLSYARAGENALIADTGQAEQIARLVGALTGSDELWADLRAAGIRTAADYSLASANVRYRAYFLGAQ